MNTEKMREDFEKCIAIKARVSLGFIMLSRINGDYSTEVLSYAWWAWQASRAALVIKAPHVSDAFNKDHPYVAAYLGGLKDFRQAVEAAGLKVNP